jgi:hypothetical protein
MVQHADRSSTGGAGEQRCEHRPWREPADIEVVQTAADLGIGATRWCDPDV